MSAPSSSSPVDVFLSYHYQRHNNRRLEHLASLALAVSGSSVLEVGAGIGDHTSYFLDRGCRVVSSEPRPENRRILAERYPQLKVLDLDLDAPVPLRERFDVVYCYGLLYHLSRPAPAIAFMAGICGRTLLLESCVSFGSEAQPNFCEERQEDPSQSVRGKGCRPTRRWIFEQLEQHFPFVYVTATQPNHEEFPIDWDASPPPAPALTRTVFVASREPIDSPVLVRGIPQRQRRHP